MRWADISFNPTAKMLRQFSGLWLIFFLIIAVFQGFLRDHWTVALICAGLALTIGPLGLIRPQTVRPIFVTWMVLAFPIGWTVSHLILGAIFYGLFTPVGCFFKLIGRDALLRYHPHDRETYWLTKTEPSARSYYHQF